jgi:hypothetical protein
MFLSKNYASKLWTNHERKFAQERAFKENRSYILPIKLDDTEIPGIPSTIGYLDLRKKTIEHVVELLLEKLQAFKGKGIDQAEGKEPVKMISEENKHDNAQQLLKVIETENKEGDNMDPARRFTYNFLSLPYDMRLDIAQQLHLIQAEDEGVHGIELFKRFFRRAREKQVLEQLKIIVNKRFEETKELLH